MDPIEEFEFKPLTEGLGFSKKADTLKNEIKSTMANKPMNSEPSHSSIFPKETKATDLTNGRATERAPTKSFGAPTGGLGAASFGSNLSETERVQPEAARAAVETSRSASQSISELMASLPPSLDFLDEKQDLTRKSEMPFAATPVASPLVGATPSSRPQIFQPLAPRETSSIATGPTVGSVLPAPGTKAGSPQAAGAMSAPTVGAPAISGGATITNARTGYSERMFESFGKTVPKAETGETTGTTTEGLVSVAVNFSAALIDAMVVAGISTILLVCIITITQINLVAMLSNASTDTATQKNLVFLFLAVLQMYMLVSRAFFGATLGEWAFDTQLGTETQQRKLTYPLQVMARSLIVTFTGLLTIPLLSFAFKRDLGKYVSGLQLFRRP
jgi:hypothetical protein